MANVKERLQVYKCGVCGNMVEAVQAQNVTTREYCNLHGLWKA